ncbi:MAG: hypothetical protein E7Z87_06485 [Cyanobacteria bacterium SIG26]|nr:hypothetical protein [Cyanobacteria bacterium SIG26]
MNVNKLTLTSIIGGKYKVIIDNPNSDIASTLIKERLSVRNGLYNDVPKIVKKLPSHLKGLVNPEYRVSHVKKIDMNA